MSVKFKAADQNNMRSECGNYLVTRRKVGEQLIYTLRYQGEQLCELICRDIVHDRLDATAELFAKAIEHFDKVKTPQ